MELGQGLLPLLKTALVLLAKHIVSMVLMTIYQLQEIINQLFHYLFGLIRPLVHNIIHWWMHLMQIGKCN